METYEENQPRTYLKAGFRAHRSIIVAVSDPRVDAQFRDRDSQSGIDAKHLGKKVDAFVGQPVRNVIEPALGKVKNITTWDFKKKSNKELFYKM